MANITVEIKCDEQGQYSVGVEPEGQEQPQEGAQGEQALLPAQGQEPAGESYLKPVKSLDEALQSARDLLQGATGQQAQQAEQDFSKGFKGPTAGGY